MTTTTNTLGTLIGRGIGRIGATTVHAACVTGTVTGQFGLDVIDGTVTGYVDHAERLAAKRALRPARIAIAVAPVAPVAKARAKA